MSSKEPTYERLTLDKIVGGGQALGTLDDGRKAFVWGGLPGEQVTICVTKKKSKFIEGIVTEVHTKSPERVKPLDPQSYLSTSPWQIMTFEVEQRYKAALIEEAFELHNIVLPQKIEVYSDDKTSHYRNKVEFSWFGDTDATSGVDTLDLAFFTRGGMGKIPVDSCSLLPEPMMKLAISVRDLLRTKDVTARNLKTLLIRCDQAGNCVWQLYLKDTLPNIITDEEATTLPAQGGELIYSTHKSPASVITERLASFGDIVLTDTILGVPFRYATEGFFQVNIPVYEQALRDMAEYVPATSSMGNAVCSMGNSPKPIATHEEEQPKRVTEISAQTRELNETDSWHDEDCLSKASSAVAQETGERGSRRAEAISDIHFGSTAAKKKVVDLYSGVGSIGLTIGGDDVTLVEINEHAVREMRENIARLDKNATAVLAPSEKALEYITSDATIIVDPPRAGLHTDVVAKLLEAAPERIIYLSCNPVTQARDVALLAEKYGIRAHQGYNFFPRTPHIEHLVVLDKK